MFIMTRAFLVLPMYQNVKSFKTGQHKQVLYYFVKCFSTPMSMLWSLLNEMKVDCNQINLLTITLGESAKLALTENTDNCMFNTNFTKGKFKQWWAECH